MFAIEGHVDRVVRVARKGFSGQALDIASEKSEPVRLYVSNEHLRNGARSVVERAQGKFLTARVARESERLWIYELHDGPTVIVGLQDTYGFQLWRRNFLWLLASLSSMICLVALHVWCNHKLRVDLDEPWNERVFKPDRHKRWQRAERL